MAVITNYSTLLQAVEDYLARSDLDSFIPNFVQNCESKLYKKLRIREMETALSGTIASGVLAVPADYIELKYAYVNVTPIRWLQRVPPEQIYSEYPVRSGAEIPRYIAREGSNFIFGPYPGAHAVAGIYYARFDALDASDNTNWFTTNAPDLLLYGSLLEAEPFIKNDVRIPMWKAFYDAALEAVASEEKREGRSGSAPQVRSM